MIFKKLFIIIILQLVFIETLYAIGKSCPNNELQYFGMKVFCENNNGEYISCLYFGAESNKVKRAYIHCENHFKSNINITVQTIECDLENGKWSQGPMKCVPECVDFPNQFELILLENLTFPNAYAEVVSNKSSKGIEKFPGIIVKDDFLLTKVKKEVSGGDIVDNFMIRIYKSISDYINFPIREAQCFDDTTNIEEQLCIVRTKIGEYISWDDKTKPICSHHLYGKPEFGVIVLFFCSKPRKKIYSPCQTTAVNKTQVELACYNWRGAAVACTDTEKREYVSIKCPIGYENLKISERDNLIAECSKYDGWDIYANEDDCKKICGVIDPIAAENDNIVLRSFNAHATDIKFSPWHAAIFSKATRFSSTYLQICGGSIVHTNIIISAAHCFWSSLEGKLHKASNFLVGVGKTYRSYDKSEEYGYYIGVSHIHIPRNFQYNPVRNDIAVVKLNRHIKFSSYIKPICINWEKYDNYNNIENKEGFVVGWGATSEADISSNELLRINLTIQSNTECKKKVDRFSRNLITDDKFCATNDIQSAPCHGDSGGGIAVLKKAFPDDIERFHLAGVVSVGIDAEKYCSEKFVALFQNIQYNQDFIKQVIKSHREKNWFDTSKDKDFFLALLD